MCMCVCVYIYIYIYILKPREIRVRRGDCQPPHIYIKNLSRHGTTPTDQPLGYSSSPQASRRTG